MSLLIGITGGIGSGKSTVCKVFQALGIPVYHADDKARTITDRNPEVITAIKARFGHELYANGSLDRPKLASIVFNNPEALQALNAIVHPAVRQEFIAWQSANAQAPYTIQEAAIMFESGVYKLMDRVVLVAAADETRIQRVLKRDNVTRDEVLSRMKNQWPEQKKLEQAHHVVWNDDNSPVLAQVLALDKLFRA